MAGGTPELILTSPLLLLCSRFHAANQLRSVPSFSFSLSPRTQLDQPKRQQIGATSFAAHINRAGGRSAKIEAWDWRHGYGVPI